MNIREEKFRRRLESLKARLSSFSESSFRINISGIAVSAVFLNLSKGSCGWLSVLINTPLCLAIIICIIQFMIALGQDGCAIAIYNSKNARKEAENEKDRIEAIKEQDYNEHKLGVLDNWSSGLDYVMLTLIIIGIITYCLWRSLS